MGQPDPPSVKISFNQNIVDGQNMLGGYSSWQLDPGGAKISPVKAKSPNPITLSGAHQLYFFSGGGALDLYFPDGAQSFNAGETINMTGPTADPGTGVNYVMMQGETSGLTVKWKWVWGKEGN